MKKSLKPYNDLPPNKYTPTLLGIIIYITINIRITFDEGGREREIFISYCFVPVDITSVVDIAVWLKILDVKSICCVEA